MSEKSPAGGTAVPTEAAALPETVKFRPRRNMVRMPAEQGRRQGAIVSLALKSLGGKDAAMAFLNAEDAELGARPIDRAMESDEAYAAVAARIAAIA